MIQNWKKAPLSHQDALDLAEARSLTLVSFSNYNLELEELEFNNLIDQHQTMYSKGTYRRERWFVVLRWKCDECEYVFDQVFYNIKRGTSHCPACRQSIQQRITYRIVKYIFKDYLSSGDFDIDKKLYKLVPQSVLARKKYKAIENKNVHIDLSSKLLLPNNKAIKLGIEHQGQQHDSNLFIGYPAFKKISKETRSVLDWQQLLERDSCKVELYRELNKIDQFLIVVPWYISPKDRYEYILNEFIRQTNLRICIDFNPSPPPNDWKEIVWGKSKVAQSSYFRRLYPKNKKFSKK
jgi:predicted Zn-ribbon and HTH transcriptional regulator